MKEPKIRFKGFSGEWETSIIGDIATFSKGRGYSKSDLRSEGNPIVLYGRLYTNYASVIDSVDTFASLKNGSVLTKGNEVIIPGSGETPEDIAVASAVEQKGVILGGDLNVLSFDHDKIVPTFAAMSITNSKTHYELSGYAQGKTVVHLHNSSISKGHISYPYIDEQRAIASYFQHLDSLIQSTTKKIESLKQVKAASLLSMFPQKGETTPRVRFKGFEGEWEKVTVSTLLEERREFEIMSDEYPLKAFIAYVGVSDKGERYDRSSLVNDVENKVYKKTELGDFIYSSNNLETGSIGLNRYGKATISPVYSIFKCTEKSYSGYIGCAFTCKDFINKMVKWRQGVMYGQWRIHELDFLKIDIFVPSFDEQRCIGNYFTTLDRQITLQTQRLEKLKQIKAACLDNMFV